MQDQDEGSGAFQFHGNWREFAPIAFTNLLLTIVTLGVYLFWARARERRYLWSQTRFIDDRLEWTGTGLELFIGYVIALFVFVLPLALVQFAIQALAIRGQDGFAALLVLGTYVAVMYLVGVAIFRALRYRLSRTFWHGIRGGTDTQGFGFGLSYLWKTIVGAMAFGLLVPWSMVSLWNERWNVMSFGPHEFRSDAKSGGLMARYLLYYLVPFVLFIGLFVMAALVGPTTSFESPEQAQAGIFGFAVIFYFGFFILLGLVALIYYAAYFREVVGNLSLGDLDFEFRAGTTDWLKLFIGNFFLVVLTLGIGTIFLGYRNWSFFVRHLHAYGSLNLDEFTQSSTREPGQGEGLLDAFDVGAI